MPSETSNQETIPHKSNFKKNLIKIAAPLVATATILTAGCTPAETPTPIPTIESTPTPELNPEREQFASDLFSLYNNAIKSSNQSFNQISNYLSPTQIENYRQTGEGIDFIADKDNSPIFALINCPPDFQSKFNNIFQEISKHNLDYLKYLKDSGIRGFMINPDGNTGAISNADGLIVFNGNMESLETMHWDRIFLTEAVVVNLLSRNIADSKTASEVSNLIVGKDLWNYGKKINNQELITIGNFTWMSMGDNSEQIKKENEILKNNDIPTLTGIKSSDLANLPEPNYYG